MSFLPVLAADGYAGQASCYFTKVTILTVVSVITVLLFYHTTSLTFSEEGGRGQIWRAQIAEGGVRAGGNAARAVRVPHSQISL